MPNSATIPTVGETQATPTLYNNLVKDAIRLLSVAGANKTIATGAIAVTPSVGESHYQVDTEGSASADDLDTITGGATGDVIGLVSANTARVVSLRSGYGNILLTGGSPVTLDTVGAFLLRYNGANWVPYGGGGSSDAATLTNKSGLDRIAGDVVSFDTANASAFTTTTYLQDLRVMGVVKSAIANNASGPVYTGAGKVCTVNVDAAAIAIGQFLISSTTAGYATGGSYFREPGVFAIALSSKAAGSIGTVTAMLVDNYRQAIIGTSGWNFGGWSGTSIGYATSQKFTMATETWATVAGAQLGGNRARGAGMSYGTVAAFLFFGSTDGANANAQNTRYKIPYSTETISTLTVSSITRHNHRSGINFSTKGWAAGGTGTGGSNSNCTVKTTFATDAESSGNNLTCTRVSQGGVSDGTYCYVGGGLSVNTDKLDISTETFTDTASAYLGNYAEGYCYVSILASAGYRCYNNGSGTAYTRKLTYATATDANHSSTPAGNIILGACVTDGVAYGYVSGAAAANKLSASTGTYASFSNYPLYTGGGFASYAAL
jgi:hypothetical protein